MTDERLKQLRRSCEAHRDKNPKAAETILELLDYIEILKSPKIDAAITASLKERAREWFNRRPSTPFSTSEERAIKVASSQNIDEESLDLLDWWYELDEQECFQKYGTGRRKTIASLFNNIHAEISKAEAAKSKILTPFKQKHAC